MKLARLLFLVPVFLSGCASGRYSLGSTTASGTASEVLVLGRRPRVAVENDGPVPLRVDFDSPDDAWDCSVTPRAGVAERTLPGPVRVRLEPTGDGQAVWTLRAWEAAGLRVDLMLEPRSLGPREVR